MYTAVEWVGWVNLSLREPLTHSVWTWEKLHELLSRAGFLSPVGKTIAPNVFAEQSLPGCGQKKGNNYTEQCYKGGSLPSLSSVERHGIFQYFDEVKS